MSFHRPGTPGVGNDVPSSTELPIPSLISGVVSGDLPVSTDLPVSPSVGSVQPAVEGDGGIRVEITPEMIEYLREALPDISVDVLQSLVGGMSTAELAGFFAGISEMKQRLALIKQQLAQQTQSAQPEVDTPEPLTEPEHTAPGEDIAIDPERFATLFPNLAEEYAQLATDEEKRAFIASHSLVIPLTEDEESGDSSEKPQDEGQTLDSLLDPRTQELMEELGPEVVAEQILIEHMDRASRNFADAVDSEFETARDKWFLRSLRWLLNISPEENIKTVGLETLVDVLILAGATSLDYFTGRPLMDQLEKIGFLGTLGIDRSTADGTADHDSVEYKSHIKLKILGQVIDFITDAMMEGGINKVYEAVNRKEMKSMFIQLGYSDEEINKYMEKWRNGSYVTPLAGVLGKLSTIFLPADLKNLVSSANLSAVQRIFRRFPVLGRYVFAPVVDFIDSRFKKWPILKGLIPTVGGVVGLTRELR